jgi:hypothetical protein
LNIPTPLERYLNGIGRTQFVNAKVLSFSNELRDTFHRRAGGCRGSYEDVSATGVAIWLIMIELDEHVEGDYNILTMIRPRDVNAGAPTRNLSGCVQSKN